ncbi:HAD family hydrolase [Streptomyces canus]|uniref:hypothetical protein n=1 Tax=Streptomyces canus TaxID=58343 RepID=UPI000A4627A1|nr:hypothetical protein [Streptomyces canus]
MASGEVPWRSPDELHPMMLHDVLTEHDLTGLTDNTDRAELASASYRLSPWPDSRDGLSRLRETHITATLSHGSTALLIHRARARGSPFYAILSAEPIDGYESGPKVYLMAADLSKSHRPGC